MEINGDFLIVEYVVKIEGIVQSHEGDGIYQAFLVEEPFEFQVLVVVCQVGIHCSGVEVSLCIKEFVDIVSEVHFWKHFLQIIS